MDIVATDLEKKTLYIVMSKFCFQTAMVFLPPTVMFVAVECVANERLSESHNYGMLVTRGFYCDGCDGRCIKLITSR